MSIDNAAPVIQKCTFKFPVPRNTAPTVAVALEEGVRLYPARSAGRGMCAASCGFAVNAFSSFYGVKIIQTGKAETGTHLGDFGKAKSIESGEWLSLSVTDLPVFNADTVVHFYTPTTLSNSPSTQSLDLFWGMGEHCAAGAITNPMLGLGDVKRQNPRPLYVGMAIHIRMRQPTLTRTCQGDVKFAQRKSRRIIARPHNIERGIKYGHQDITPGRSASYDCEKEGMGD